LLGSKETITQKRNTWPEKPFRFCAVTREE
jgi:hypothetical protein